MTPWLSLDAARPVDWDCCSPVGAGCAAVTRHDRAEPAGCFLLRRAEARTMVLLRQAQTLAARGATVAAAERGRPDGGDHEAARYIPGAQAITQVAWMIHLANLNGLCAILHRSPARRVSS